MAKLTNTPRSNLVLDLERRKSFIFQVSVSNVDGTPVDLTGCTLRFVMKEASFDNDAFDLNNIIVNSEANIAEPTLGYGVFSFQANELDGEPGEYSGTIVLWTSTGYSLVLLKPTINLLENTESLSMQHEYLAANPPSEVELQLRGNQVVNITTATLRPDVVSRGPCVRSTAQALAGLDSSVTLAVADLRAVTYPDGRDVEPRVGDIVLREGAGFVGGVITAKTDTTVTVLTRFTE